MFIYTFTLFKCKGVKMFFVYDKKLSCNKKIFIGFLGFIIFFVYCLIFLDQDKIFWYNLALQ